MQVTRELLRELRIEITDAINATDIGERYGVTLELGNASYDAHSFHFKLNGGVTDIGDGRPAAAAEWDMYRSRFGLGAVEFGATFSTRSGEYVVCGIAPKSRKYPVIGIGTDGRMRKFVPQAVLPSGKMVWA